LVALSSSVLIGLGAWALLEAYQRLGRTPMEWLDYLDLRLQGHTRLERWAQPVLAELRSSLHAPSAAERAAMPMVVPPPPPRRGAAEVLPPKPVPRTAKVWRVGPGGPVLRIADAARLAQDGDVVEIESGDYRQDVAVWPQRRLTIRGVNGAARLYADGHAAESKAIWVLRNGQFDIANIDFIGTRVGDGNGAGIRFEGGALRLRQCLFWGNQMGLLTGGEGTMPDATLVIEDSEFAYSRVQGRWGHNLYVGTIASLTMRGSYSHHAGVGHLLKSRARRNQVLYNRLTDESGGRASYELEFPNGGEALVVGNVIQQQEGTENGVMVAYGLEGLHWPVNTLTLASNTLVNDHPLGGSFLRVAQGVDLVRSANNLLVGVGRFQVPGPLVSMADVRVNWDVFVRPARYDYRLRRPQAALAYRPLDDTALQLQMVPKAEYRHPRSTQALVSPPAWVGAVQQTAD
jgi:hypothetical protein